MIVVRFFHNLTLVSGFVALLWFGGLVVFAAHVSSMDAATIDTDPTPVDAIVVPTGGSERVRTGVELLKSGKGKKLFISGVYHGLTPDKILGGIDVPDDLRACCITLGHAAESTEGNAEETRNWLTYENYHSLRLVTANYHMPRTLLMFHTLLPDAAIIPHPVVPENVILNGWWYHPGTASLLVTEYNKYLFAYLGVGLNLI